MSFIRIALRAGALAWAAATLAGCAAFSADGGFDEVAERTRERTGQEPVYQRSAADTHAADARVAALLQQPLDADRAVQVALLANRGLQARFAELGIAEADLVQASRPAGPTLAISRLAGGGVFEVERSIVVDLLGLVASPAARQAGQDRFEQAKWQAAIEAVRVAAEARKGFFRAVAAGELLHYQRQVQDAADAAGELALRMQQAGNFSALAQLREQAFAAEAAAELRRAELQAVVERERLARLLGSAAFTLPPRLPDLPAAPLPTQDAEQAALDHRLDVLQARRAAEALAQAAGIAPPAGWLESLNLGWRDKAVSGEARQRGAGLELQIPWLAGGSPGQARAEARYVQAVHHAAALAHDARSEVRASTAAYLAAYELARHYRDEVVPLRQRIADENLLRYNGMLASVFELLADAREQIGSVSAAIGALRDYWLAETDLQTALSTGSPSATDSR